MFLCLIVEILFIDSRVARADNVTLYTPYTKVSVSPGGSINYSIDVINNTKEVQENNIYVSGISRKWNYSFKSGGMNVRRIAILPNEKKTLTLKVNVPFRVNKGNYFFSVNAGSVSLPLTINISEKGSGESELTTEQANMQGTTKSSFSFRAKLQNRTAEPQMYALMASKPRGWNVAFKVNGKQVSSVELDENGTKNINIDIKAPHEIAAGKYEIPIKAVTKSTTAKLNLEVVITGTYDIDLRTPTGLLSTKITAGDKKKIELEVKNTGTSSLSGIKMKALSPKKWDVVFEPTEIDKLEPGKTAPVYATIEADKKAIPGDYVTKITAKTPDAKSEASFRISVRTSMLWGWLGILIIAIALGIVYYLFRKYGRR